MNHLPSWVPVFAAIAASLAAAAFLPAWSAIAVLAALCVTVMCVPFPRDKPWRSRCTLCRGQCRAVLPAEDGEPLSGGEARRWIGITGTYDAGTVAAEREYRRQP